ncbi:hypothetical protein Glove_229g69 [Diversispora epigaea]|uniref:Uncharacterized protein n=1 Tax=Diversispora epigaea TaxID=1348612 RepID=A0A397ID20_9GLOM|nr:hypothetical protein Glove_229g69 [Diversispora epigaea]
MVKNDSSLTENEKNVLRITGTTQYCELCILMYLENDFIEINSQICTSLNSNSEKSAFYAMQSGNHPHHIE